MAIRLHFYGAAGEVTGSCCLVETDRARILVDCGLFQGSRRGENRNRRPPGLRLDGISGVVLTHAHLDHCGRLPVIVRDGFDAPIHATGGTLDLAKIILRDAAHLQEEDARRTTRKNLRRGKPPVEPLFDSTNVAATLPLFRTHPYDREFDVAPGIRARFRDAGHILGSAWVELLVDDGDATRKLIFSGDLGHVPTPLLRDPDPATDADLTILESTYGDRRHRGYDETLTEFADVLREAQQSGGKVLIPAFAVGRTQTLLYHLRQFRADGVLDAKVPVFLDSPMAISATDAYEQHSELFDAEARELLRRSRSPVSFPGFQELPAAKDSRELNDLEGPAVIVAGAGMCNGGRILQHFKHHIWRRETHVIMAGFMAEGTIGRRIVDGAPTIRIFGETVRINAQVHTIGGFSAHADQQELVDWVAPLAKHGSRLVLVHGEDRPRQALADRIQREHGVAAELPAYRGTVTLGA